MELGLGRPGTRPATRLTDDRRSGSETSADSPRNHSKGPIFMTKAMCTGVLVAAWPSRRRPSPEGKGGQWPRRRPGGPRRRMVDKLQPARWWSASNNYADKEILPRAHAEADAKALFDLFTSKQYDGVDAAHARLLLGAEDGKNSQRRPPARTPSTPCAGLATKEAGPKDPVIFAFFGEGVLAGRPRRPPLLPRRRFHLQGPRKGFRRRRRDFRGSQRLQEPGLRRLPRREFPSRASTPPADGKPIPGSLLHREAVRGVPRRPRLRRGTGSSTPGRIVFVGQPPHVAVAGRPRPRHLRHGPARRPQGRRHPDPGGGRPRDR